MSVPRNLRFAANAVRYRSDFQVVGNWERIANQWVLRIKIDIGEVPQDSLVPSVTSWHFVVSDSYPLGDIRVYPSVDGGLTQTFQHQFQNKLSGDLPFRLGNICTGNPFHVSVSSGESFDPSRRLYNYVEWTKRWALGAANKSFHADGELFELPDYGVSGREISLVHLEGSEELKTWQSIPDAFGLAAIAPSAFDHKLLVVTEFRTRQDQVLVTMPWREEFADSDGEYNAVWLRLPKPPVLPPFAAPTTWGEMEEALTLIDQQLVRRLDHARRLARRSGANLLLMGYPISDRYGEPEKVMEWQPIRLPSFGDSQIRPKSFRNTPEGLARSDNARNFYPSAIVDYRKGANWSSRVTQSRGRLKTEVEELRVVLVGAGALGSLVAEALVRGGLMNLHIVDPDTLAIGNLARHTLLVTDLDRGKATVLAERLEKANIHSTVTSSASKFHPNVSLDGFDAIIDTTGNAEVIEILHALAIETPMHFFTFSVSLGAKHLYGHHQFGRSFNPEVFTSTIGKLALKNYQQFPEDAIPREYVGCWHPVFPARMDQMMMLSSVVAPEIERQLTRTAAGKLVSSCVFEVEEDDYGVTGLKRRELSTE